MALVISLLIFIFAKLDIGTVGGDECKKAKCMFKKIVSFIYWCSLTTIQFWDQVALN